MWALFLNAQRGVKLRETGERGEKGASEIDAEGSMRGELCVRVSQVEIE